MQLALILINLPINTLKGNNYIWGISQAFLININISYNYRIKLILLNTNLMFSHKCKYNILTQTNGQYNLYIYD